MAVLSLLTTLSWLLRFEGNRPVCRVKEFVSGGCDEQMLLKFSSNQSCTTYTGSVSRVNSNEVWVETVCGRFVLCLCCFDKGVDVDDYVKFEIYRNKYEKDAVIIIQHQKIPSPDEESLSFFSFD